MKIACESFVKDLLPAVRALVARDLIQEYGLTQREAARRLRMTQPAISQYKNKLRGKKTEKLEDSSTLSEKIGSLAEGIVREKFDPEDYNSFMCDICKAAQEESLLEEFSCEG